MKRKRFIKLLRARGYSERYIKMHTNDVTERGGKVSYEGKFNAICELEMLTALIKLSTMKTAYKWQLELFAAYLGVHIRGHPFTRCGEIVHHKEPITPYNINNPEITLNTGNIEFPS